MIKHFRKVSFLILFIFVGGIFIFHNWFSGGNHWPLFGTWVDRLIRANVFLCAVVCALPGMIPVVFKASKQNIVLAAVSLLLFLFYLFAFARFAD